MSAGDLVNRKFDRGNPNELWVTDIERREALFNRVEVKDLHHAAQRPDEAGGSLIRETPVRGGKQPRQRRDGPALPDGSGPASETGRCTRGTSG